MNIFDFITQDEIDDLPDDDPQTAFVQFVRTAQHRLGERTTQIDESDRSGWEELNEARLGFMNVVIAAAKKYEIEPFATLSVPRLKDFGTDEHRQFKADLDHYLTQLLLDNSSRSKRDSVLVSPELKDSIRTYIFHLRKLIESANDLDEAKRQVLLRRLTDFEAELDKKRLNLMAVTVLAITLAGAPGALWSSADAANKLLTNILRVRLRSRRAHQHGPLGLAQAFRLKKRFHSLLVIDHRARARPSVPHRQLAGRINTA